MSSFETPARFPEPPAPDEAHVWRVDLVADPAGGDPADLAPAEILRAQRFAFERDRRRFVRSRLALRALLAGYLGAPPAEIEIAIEANGKPFVPGAPIGFNLSHSGDTALIAFSAGPAIGVDLEAHTGRENLRELCELVLAPSEREAFAAIPDARLAGPFLALWTRKEAVLKALGTGLMRDPRSLEVGAQGRIRLPGEGSSFVEVATILDDGAHAAALAVGGGMRDVRLFLGYPAWPGPGAQRPVVAAQAARW